MSAFGLFFPVEHEGKEDSSVTVTQLTQNDQNLEKKKKKKKRNCVYTIFLLLPFQAADKNLMKKLYIYSRLKCQHRGLL